MRAARLHPRGRQARPGPSFIRGLLLSSRAVAFGPRDAHHAGDADLSWRPLTGAPLARRHSAAWPKGRGDAAVRAFADTVTDALGRTAADPDLSTGPLHLRPAAEYWI